MTQNPASWSCWILVFTWHPEGDLKKVIKFGSEGEGVQKFLHGILYRKLTKTYSCQEVADIQSREQNSMNV